VDNSAARFSQKELTGVYIFCQKENTGVYIFHGISKPGCVFYAQLKYSFAINTRI
jgi:hypothetical protein